MGVTEVAEKTSIRLGRPGAGAGLWVSHSTGSEPGQVADEEDDVAGVDVGADGPVGFGYAASRMAVRCPRRSGQGVREDCQTHARCFPHGRDDAALRGRFSSFGPVFPVRDLRRALAHYASLGFFEVKPYADRGYGFAGAGRGEPAPVARRSARARGLATSTSAPPTCMSRTPTRCTTSGSRLRRRRADQPRRRHAVQAA